MKKIKIYTGIILLASITTISSCSYKIIKNDNNKHKKTINEIPIVKEYQKIKKFDLGKFLMDNYIK